MDREIKMKLLEALMDEMDEASLSRLKKEPMVNVKKVEEKEMPLEDAKDMIKEKMLSSEAPESEEVIEVEQEDEEDDFGSDLMRRLREAKMKKGMK